MCLKSQFLELNVSYEVTTKDTFRQALTLLLER